MNRFFISLVAIGVAVLIMAVTAPRSARPMDLGQWQDDPALATWYRTLMMPDSPAVSCCGEADAYWCDRMRTSIDFEGKAHNFCAITDDREDAPRRRPHRSIGEEFEIPDHKLKWDAGNPTGHQILFLSRSGTVYCFVLGTGG